MSPSMHTRGRDPLVSPGRVGGGPHHGPPGRQMGPVVFWARASRELKTRARSAQARGVEDGAHNGPAAPSGRVPLRRGRASLLIGPTAAGLGLGGLGRGHVARDVVARARLEVLPSRVRGRLVAQPARRDVAWPASNVHLDRLLRGLVARHGGGGPEGVARGVASDSVVVGLRRHPPLEPGPTPLGLLSRVYLGPELAAHGL